MNEEENKEDNEEENEGENEEEDEDGDVVKDEKYYIIKQINDYYKSLMNQNHSKKK